MRNTSLTITASHLFPSVSEFSAESEPSTITLRFIVHGTFQINQSNFFYF